MSAKPRGYKEWSPRFAGVVALFLTECCCLVTGVWAGADPRADSEDIRDGVISALLDEFAGARADLCTFP